MIPKIIHYCWLSKEKQSPFIQGCIRSWRKIMPDYQIICWDVNRFDLNLSPFAKEAYEKRNGLLLLIILDYLHYIIMAGFI